MKNFSKQKKHGQCGVYALANALEDENIYELYSDKYIPCGEPEMNEILEKEGYGIRVHPVVSSLHWKHEIPKNYTIKVVNYFKCLCDKSEGDFVFPLILIVQAGNNEYGIHAVTLLITKHGLNLSDPMEEHMESISIDELLNKYKYISGIEGFIDEDGNYISLESSFYNDRFALTGKELELK